MHNPESVPENKTHKTFWDFEIQTDQLISARPADLVIVTKKNRERTHRIVDFAVSIDHRVKLKESEKGDKYLDHARELKIIWNMKVTMIQYVIGALGTVAKRLVQWLEELEIRGREETI